MTKPRNFPERKRQRQLGALSRIRDFTIKTGRSNAAEIVTLHERTAGGSLRDVRTKKYRGAAQ